MRVFLYALYLSIIPLSDAADIYLDPKGLDSNPGSAQKPVKSIKKAQELARELISSTDDDITVRFSPGTWMIDEPISFTGKGSGISGLEITYWVEGDDGIWSASVPEGTKSRNLFVNGFAAQYARRQIHSRKDFNYTKVGMTWNSSDYDWIMETPGIENGELRAINSFPDRIALIHTVEDRVLKMKSRIWANQIIGYDQIAEPFWDGGVWIQNVKAFLTDGGQFYLDKNESIVYYKPLEGDDMTTASTYLGIKEILLAIGGTYEEPVHNLHFGGITFEHSTWLKPDKNAHFTGIGLGADNINISDNYFTQVMGNSITVGGIQADAHHPSDSLVIHVPILFTYTQFSSIAHNGIYNHPYSGICHGYGWGSNDAGGSEEYIKRGLYKYQPIYDEPTVMKNNLTEGNLIHRFGQSHTDFGGVYTLSLSPNTTVSSNFIYDAGWQALYPDEASRNITWFSNLGFTSGKYYAPNDWIPEQLTGCNTVIDNWGKLGIKDNEVLDGFPNFSGRRNNTFLRNFLAPHVNATSLLAQRAAYRAGVIPSKRKTRPVTNCPDIADGHLDVRVNRGRVFVNVTNFDDVDFIDGSFHLSVAGVIFKEEYSPNLIPADDYAMAVYTFSGSPEGNYTARVNYVNPWTRSSSRQKEFSLTA